MLTNKTKKLFYLWALIVIAIMMAFTSIACKRKPTAVQDFTIVDESQDETGNIKTNESGKIDEETYKDKLIFKKIYPNGGNNLVIAAADDKNVLLAYDRDGEIYYIASANDGARTTTEQKLGARGYDYGYAPMDGAIFKAPHIFVDGNTLRIIVSMGSESSSIWGNIYQIIGTITTGIEDGKTYGYIDYGNTIWKTIYLDDGNNDGKGPSDKLAKYLGIKNDANNFSYAILGGIGKEDTIPIYYQAFGKYGIVTAKRDNTKQLSTWKIENKTELVEGSQKGKLIEVDNGINLLAGAEGKMLKSFKVGVSLSSITETEMIASFEGGFEAAKTKEGILYALSGNKLCQYAHGFITSYGERKVIIGNGTKGGSVAVLSDGTIATFTKETGGLVFRRFTKDFFEKQADAGSPII